MPRPRARPLFELEGQWIAARPGRRGLYRFWPDPGTGRTARASLGTTDLEKAKFRLAEIVTGVARKTINDPLTLILEKYFVDVTDKKPSKDAARAAGRLFLECWGVKVRAVAIDARLQEKFVRWSYETCGHSAGYVARNLGVLNTAMTHSKIAVDIVYSEGAIAEKWPELLPAHGPRKIYEPSDEELARLLAAPVPENLRRWVMNSMATLARPAAVLELSPASRDRAAGMIALNPEGRRQNKKHRPVVRELACQTRWLDAWEKEEAKRNTLAASGDDAPAAPYCGYASVDSVDTALDRAKVRPDVNIPRLAAYSIRHRGTTVLRDAGVGDEKIDAQLGHRPPKGRTTRGYGTYTAAYFEPNAKVLEAWIARVLRMAAEIKKPRRRRAA